eukprot:246163_1
MSNISSQSQLSIQTHTCYDTVASCYCLNRLKQIIHLYNEQNDIDKLIKLDMVQILNNYLHLLNEHNTDKEFELIFNTLGYCDISKCAAFWRRNGKHRKTQKLNKECNKKKCLG